VAVDRFSADILARNPMDDSVVLIENQLEQTDHTHLGRNTAGIYVRGGRDDRKHSAARLLSPHADALLRGAAPTLATIRAAMSWGRDLRNPTSNRPTGTQSSAGWTRVAKPA